MKNWRKSLALLLLGSLEYFVNVLSGFNLLTIRQGKWFQIGRQMMMMIDGSNDDKEIVYDDNGGGQVL